MNRPIAWKTGGIDARIWRFWNSLESSWEGNWELLPAKNSTFCYHPSSRPWAYQCVHWRWRRYNLPKDRSSIVIYPSRPNLNLGQFVVQLELKVRRSTGSFRVNLFLFENACNVTAECSEPQSPQHFLVYLSALWYYQDFVKTFKRLCVCMLRVIPWLFHSANSTILPQFLVQIELEFYAGRCEFSWDVGSCGRDSRRRLVAHK